MNISYDLVKFANVFVLTEVKFYVRIFKLNETKRYDGSFERFRFLRIYLMLLKNKLSCLNCLILIQYQSQSISQNICIIFLYYINDILY